MHLGLLALGVGTDDEVVTPSFTFVAGAQCVREVGGCPVFCDIDRETLSVTVETIDAAVTPRTKAIIALPYAGRPLGIESIREYARERNIAVIEDAAHAVGMLDKGKWAGTESALAAYSFYATKNIATAEGGMLVTNDDGIAERVRRLSLHGMSRDAWKRYQGNGGWRYDVLELGYKYNMTDLAAALGLAQFQRLSSMQSRRRSIAQQYLDALAGLPGLYPQLPPEHSDDEHAWCMFAVLVAPDEAGITRDGLVQELREQNVGTSVHYIPTHTLTAYRDVLTAPLPNTEWVFDRIFSLPLYPTMSDADVRDVVAALRSSVRSYSMP